ncbi:hypothetical protein IFM89_036908 [Coptis chinensis]|uniref:Clp R domain-containing protein n=1 Tax=Coptis chinensis TaxID=261450 RepID=A0A835HXJ2_9MAGN|nr:hypothetical protein IFM89_036908 [Coptis chinensis]
MSNISGGDESAKSVERVLNQALKKIPSQTPPSTSLINVIRRAQSHQKLRRDTHLAIDQLILGLLEDSQVRDVLKEAGVRGARVKTEVEKLRGKEGTKGSSASGYSNFQALKTYGHDLVEQATELDPVIGRDEEIRSLMRILSRRTKNNPILIGEPGVGKTTWSLKDLSAGLLEVMCLVILKMLKFVALDMDALVAVTSIEERLQSVLK